MINDHILLTQTAVICHPDRTAFRDIRVTNCSGFECDTRDSMFNSYVKKPTGFSRSKFVNGLIGISLNKTFSIGKILTKASLSSNISDANLCIFLYFSKSSDLHIGFRAVVRYFQQLFVCIREVVYNVIRYLYACLFVVFTFHFRF